ncbi:MAG: arylsulfotransferase family protein, partial [Solirubrobacteraceae bacterium]
MAALMLTGCGAARVLSKPKPLPEIGSSGVKPAGSVAAYHSRPDLRPPAVTTAAAAGTTGLTSDDPGLLFLGPGPVSLNVSQQYGPLIVNRSGTPVWFRPLPKGLQVTNFARADYKGKPALVWWEGKIEQSGYGQGEAVLVDQDYHEIARVRAAGGRSMDLHALTVTPGGTALFTCYPRTVPMNLSSIGAPANSQVLESIIQEVDIASGRLLFEWRSLDHVPVNASEEPHAEPYDYLHINSIQQLPDGNLLVSGRHTWALYKLDRDTGKIIWTLGGKQSQLEMGTGAQFAWQHDARQHSDGLVTVFDNGTNGPIKTESQSRGLVLDVDESRRRVTVRNSYKSPQGLSAGAMGSVQLLSPDRVLVGWGVQSHTIEYDSSGKPLVDMALPAGMYSYRGLWFPWQGTPHHRPAVATARYRQSGATMMYASWNGAT